MILYSSKGFSGSSVQFYILRTDSFPIKVQYLIIGNKWKLLFVLLVVLVPEGKKDRSTHNNTIRLKPNEPLQKMEVIYFGKRARHENENSYESFCFSSCENFLISLVVCTQLAFTSHNTTQP